MIVNRSLYGMSGAKSLFNISVDTTQNETVSFSVEGNAHIVWGDKNIEDVTTGTAQHNYAWTFPVIDYTGEPESGYTFFNGLLRTSICDGYSSDQRFNPSGYGFTSPRYYISEALGLEWTTWHKSVWVIFDNYDEVDFQGFILPNGTKLGSAIDVDKNILYINYEIINCMNGDQQSRIKMSSYGVQVDQSWILRDFFVAFDQMQEVKHCNYDYINGTDRPDIHHNFKIFGEYPSGELKFIGDSCYDTWYDHMPAFASFKDKRDFNIGVLGHLRHISFEGCTQLIRINSPISASYQNKDYTRMFKGCTGLTGIPSDLFSNILEADDFTECFSGCTALTGEAPPLWLMFPNAIGNACFNGCTGLSNYSSIPSNWKF